MGSAGASNEIKITQQQQWSVTVVFALESAPPTQRPTDRPGRLSGSSDCATFSKAQSTMRQARRSATGDSNNNNKLAEYRSSTLWRAPLFCSDSWRTPQIYQFEARGGNEEGGGLALSPQLRCSSLTHRCSSLAASIPSDGQQQQQISLLSPPREERHRSDGGGSSSGDLQAAASNKRTAASRLGCHFGTTNNDKFQ